MKQFLQTKRVWFFLLLPISLIASAIISSNPDWAETYATTVYPTITQKINAVTSMFPYSIMEMLLIYLVVQILVSGIVIVVHLVRKKETWKEVLRKIAANVLCAAGVITFLFTLNCGINYSRHTFAEIAGLDVRPSSTAELKALSTDLAQEANRLRSSVVTNEEGITYLDSFVLSTFTAKQNMDNMKQYYPVFQSGYGAPKPVSMSTVMSYLDITGVYFPFTVEANVNTDAPDYSIPATMMHELAHVQGFMREDEANFIAYLSCMKSDDVQFQYSGAAMAFIHANNALFAADPEAGREVYALLSEEVKRDFSDGSAYWKKFQGPIANVSSKINDTYLKSNRQDDGVKSYGRMVDLLLAEHRQQKEAGASG